MLLRRALLVLALSLLAGCHLSYDVTNVPGPTEYHDVAISVSPAPVWPAEPATIGKLALTRDARTYVAAREVHYSRRWSLFRAWTAEDLGFRTTVWWYGKKVFPVTSSILDGTDKDDLFGLTLLTCGLIIDIPFFIDLCLYLGTPLVDSLTILGSGLADLLTGGLSAPPILIKGAIDGRNPDPDTELFTSRQETITAANHAFTYSFSVADAPGGSATTLADGSVPVPLARAAERALATGQPSLTVTIATDSGCSTTRTIGAAELVTVHAGDLARRGVTGAAAIAEWRRLEPSVAAEARSSVASQLEALGFVSNVTDAQALAVFRQRSGGLLRTADGQEIDWSVDATSGTPRAAATVALANGATSIDAGATLAVSVSVTNDGDGPLQRLVGHTRCALSELAAVPILFGRVAPGATVTRRLELALPRSTRGGALALIVDFDEQNGRGPQPARGQIDVRAAPQPFLGVAVLPAREGEPIVRGEKFDVHVTVVNTGAVAASRAVLDVVLPDAVEGTGAQRFELGTIDASETREETLTLRVNPAFTGPRVTVTANVAESSEFRAHATSSVVLDVTEPTKEPAVAFTAPTAATETTAATLAVKATAKARHGVATVRVLVNGREVAKKAGEGARSLDVAEIVPLEVGENLVAVEATTTKGERGSAEVVVVRTK